MYWTAARNEMDRRFNKGEMQPPTALCWSKIAYHSHLSQGTWPHTVRPQPWLCPPRSGWTCSPPWPEWRRDVRSEDTQSGTSGGGTEWNWPPRLKSLLWSWSWGHMFCLDTRGQKNKYYVICSLFEWLQLVMMHKPVLLIWQKHYFVLFQAGWCMLTLEILFTEPGLKQDQI